MHMMDATRIAGRLAECGLDISFPACEQLARYHCMLMDWNTRMDLTAVTDEEDMLDRHYVDALMLLRFPDLLPASGRVIDVGTGAGLPGLPLAIARPDLSFTLLDSQQKRLTFLDAVISDLALLNVTLVHARAEDGGRDKTFRDCFDLAVARAVAPLPVLAELLLPYVRPGALAVCWKGPSVAQEREAGRKAAFVLGGSLGEDLPYTFPGRDWQHVLVPLCKRTPTPKTYPRKAGIPARRPLGVELLR